MVSLLLGESWDLATRDMHKITILISIYNPNEGSYNLTKSHDPPSSGTPGGALATPQFCGLRR